MHVILPRSGFELGSIQGEEPLYRLQYHSGNATDRFQLDRGSPFGADAPKGSLNEVLLTCTSGFIYLKAGADPGGAPGPGPPLTLVLRPQN